MTRKPTRNLNQADNCSCLDWMAASHAARALRAHRYGRQRRSQYGPELYLPAFQPPSPSLLPSCQRPRLRQRQGVRTECPPRPVRQAGGDSQRRLATTAWSPGGVHSRDRESPRVAASHRRFRDCPAVGTSVSIGHMVLVHEVLRRLVGGRVVSRDDEILTLKFATTQKQADLLAPYQHDCLGQSGPAEPQVAV